MNSIRCSRATTALLCVAVLLATAGTVSAFSLTSEGVPAESQVGSEVSTVTYTIDDPFTDTAEQWTLDGSTELRNVSWTVTVLRAGNQVSETTYGDRNFTQDLNVDNNGDQVVVELAGTTPAIENYSYSPEETYQVASLSRVTGSNSEQFVDDTAHHYTADSDEARAAIEDAQAAIDAAGGHGEAEGLVESAVSAYESEDWDNAERLASNAETKASNAERNSTILLGVAGLLAVLVLLGGGYYLLRSGDDDYTKL